MGNFLILKWCHTLQKLLDMFFSFLSTLTFRPQSKLLKKYHEGGDVKPGVKHIFYDV